MNETEERPLKCFLAKVISGGRVTIPEAIRLLHGIKENCIVELKILKVVPRSPENVDNYDERGGKR